MAKRAVATATKTEQRETLILAPSAWRDRLAQELVAVGVGHDQARLVAVRVLKGLIAGNNNPQPEESSLG